MATCISLYIPNKIKVNEVILGNTYQINYNLKGKNYKFVGKIHFGTTYTDGRYWFSFINIKKYYENDKKKYKYPKNIDFVYIPDSYIPDENEARIYKKIHGPNADIRETYTGFKLNSITEFPYEITANFNSLPNDINREIRRYLF
jgi:hypothetical protein